MRLVAPCSARAAQRPGAPRMRRAAPSRALQRGRRTCESTELEPFITCSHLCTHVPSGLSGVLSARAAAAAVRAPRRGRAAPALLPGSGGGGGRPAAGTMGARRVLAAVVVRCDPRPLIRGGEGGQERQAGILRCRQAGILRCRQAGILRCRCRETGTEKAAEGGGGGGASAPHAPARAAPAAIVRRAGRARVFCRPAREAAARAGAPWARLRIRRRCVPAGVPRRPRARRLNAPSPRASLSEPRRAPVRSTRGGARPGLGRVLWRVRLGDGRARRATAAPPRRGAGRRLGARRRGAPPPPSPRTKWTRCVPHPVLIRHAASLTPY